MDKKKIGIITFHASHNYGSVLQAYALQHYLKKNGHDAIIINLRTKQQRELYPCPFILSHPYKKNAIRIARHPVLFYKSIKRWYAFERFIKKEIETTSVEYHSTDSLKIDLPNLSFDVLICGGDQIWNQCCSDFDLAYLLPFKNIKKISYAPSLGSFVEVMKSSKYAQLYIKYLADFDVLSVREPDASIFLSELISSDVKVIPDAAFLLTETEFHLLSTEQKRIKESYIFYYTPSHFLDIRSLEIAKKYAKELGLKLVTTYSEIFDKNIKYVNDSGPKEFLSLIENADFVIGRSFHLAVFALMFHKEFLIIDGDKDTRIVNLFKEFKIEDRVINLESPLFAPVHCIDYYSVDQNFRRLRSIAENYLSNSL